MRRFLDELGVRVKPQLPGLSPEERAALSDAVGKLNSHERRVLELRYGLWGENPHTLGEVAEMFRVSPHRIQRIEQQALKKLPVLARHRSGRRDSGDVTTSAPRT
jgi:DNA-directed RNA polymerase sigma subunit (sigma70/sigma32)